ncbi:MAG: PAS domain S-box protein [Sodalinema sp.]|uniref:PAS domain S-box protein n=1 Tax=Sodalinema sp. TaxID=3080550 RepID=UPI001200B2EE|nr:MAG: PAS domain S-box protein [Phormidium sp. SL48-SHIP]
MTYFLTSSLEGSPSSSPSHPHSSSVIMDSLFSRMSEASWLVDWPSGKFLSLNPAAETLYGRSQASPVLTQPRWQDTIAPEHREFVCQRIHHYLRQHQTNPNQADLSLDYALIRPDGRLRWVRSRIWQYPGTSGTQLQGLTLDLTSQRELYDQKLQFEKLATNIPGVIYQYVLRPDGSSYFSYMSPRCQDLYELEASALAGEPDLAWSLIHPDDIDHFNASVAESAKTLTTWTHQWRNYSRSGILKWFSGTAQPEQRANGDIVWDGMMIDISQQKQAEVDRDRFFDCALDLFGIVSFDGYFRRLNPAWEKTLGFSIEELKAQPFSTFIHPDDLERTQAEVEKISNGDNTLWFENRYQTRDGDYRWLAWRTVSFPEEGLMYASARDITEEKRIEAERERLITILEASPDFISSADLTGNVTYINQGGRDIVGLDADEPASHYHVGDFIPETMMDFFETQAIPKALQDGIWKGTAKLKRADGSYFPVSQIILHHPGTENHDGYLSTIARDITESQAIQECLRQQEEFLRSIYDSQGNLVFVLDLAEDGEWRYSDWNASTEKVSGIRREEIRGKTPLEVFGPKIGQDFLNSYLCCLTTGEITTVQQTFPDGDRTLYFQAHLTPLFDAQGQIYRIVGNATDITERKEVELALKASKTRYRSLAQQEKLVNNISQQIRKSLDLRTLLDSTVQAIYEILDIDRCYVLLYNEDSKLPDLELATEAKREDLPSRLNDYHSSFFELLNYLLQQRHSIRVDQASDIEDGRLRQKVNQLGYQSLLLFPINSGDGNIGTLACSREIAAKPWSDRDIELLQAVGDRLAIAIQQAVLYQKSRQSEQRAIAKTAELEHTLKQLQQTQTQLIQAEKMSGLGQLVAGVAHEINNPVSFIFGNLVHAKEYSQDLLELIGLYQQHCLEPHPEIESFIEEIDLDYLTEDMPDLFSSIETGALRIQKIVRSLRTFSRLDEAELKTINLNESLDSTLMILASRLRGNETRPDIELVCDYGELPEVNCYAGALNQVFMNLINNAVDAINDSGQTQGVLTLETAVRDSSIVIKIRDNGSGIPEAVRDRIFDPFYTTKPVGKGTGLGLSISYQIIVERHQGTLTCDSTPGEGSTFAIELPLKNDSGKQRISP